MAKLRALVALGRRKANRSSSKEISPRQLQTETADRRPPTHHHRHQASYSKIACKTWGTHAPSFCVNYLLHSAPQSTPLHHLLPRVHNLHPAGVHNTRCATQCLARPRVTPSSLGSGGFCHLESCECTCSVSNNAKRHRSSHSIR